MSNENNKKKWYSDKISQKPTKVNGQKTTRTEFYRKELYKIVKSIFKLTVPEDWDYDYVLRQLLVRGYFVITKSSIGPIATKASLTGINYMSLPTKAMIALPILGRWESTIGKDCEVVYLERIHRTYFYTLTDLVQITAEKLASCDCGIDVNVMNSRLAYIAEAETKAQMETIMKLFDEISEGNPLVVYRKDAIAQGAKGLQVFFNNVKQNYIADMIQDTKRSIMNEFLTSLGINNANTDKRERLNSDEVNANNIELMANVDLWKENLKRQVKKVKKIFPELDFNIELRYDALYKSSPILNGGIKNDSGKPDRTMGDGKQ